MNRTTAFSGESRSGKRLTAALVGLTCVLAGCTSNEVDSATPDIEPVPFAVPSTPTNDAVLVEEGEVVEVIDGDTIDVRIAGVVVRVRLIGMNTPEVGECFAAEATAALAATIEGEAVRLESDTSDRDQYGRLLRYVYFQDVLINERLVLTGLAIARRYEPDTAFAERFEAAQQQAQDSGVGLWAPDACGRSAEGVEMLVEQIEYDAPGNDGENLNGEWIVLRNQSSSSVDMTGWVLKDESASHRYSFPDGFELQPNSSVQVFSGCGVDTASQLFWCTSGSAIWNNSGDTVFVLDTNGNIVVSRNY